MKKQILYTLISVISLFTAVPANADHIKIDHYSVKDGLSENTVVSMFQDRKGIMWFGTFAGLNRFDGYTFRTFKVNTESKSGLAHSRIDYITEDTYGFLWLITYTGIVQRFDPRTEEFINIPDFEASLPKNNSPIVKLHSFASGEIWLITKSNGVYCAQTNAQDSTLSIRHFGKENKLINTNYTNAIHKDWQKNIWLMSENGLVQISNNLKDINHYFEENQEGKTKGSQEFFCAMELDNEILFGASYGRIWSFDKASQSFKLQKMPVNSNVTDIKKLSDNKFIVLTSKDGFIVLDRKNNIIDLYNKSTNKAVTSDKMISSYIDRKGNVWIETTADGVLHFNPTNNKLDNFVVKTDETSRDLLHPNFFIFEDKHSNLWVHPRSGGFSRYNRTDNRLEPFYNEPGSADRRFSNLMHSAMSDAQGNLWMCTYSKGLEKIRFLSSEFRLIKPNPTHKGLYENEVRAVFEDRDGYHWIATKDASIYLMDKDFNNLGYLSKDGRINKGEKLNVLGYCFYQDKKGRIWIGTKGVGICLVSRRNSGNEHLFDINNFRSAQNDIYSLSHDAVYTFFEDKNNRLWIGTFGGGVNMVDENDGRIEFINHRNTLRSYPISQCQKVRHIASDSIGNIWAATTNGMVCFEENFTSAGAIKFIQVSPGKADYEDANLYDMHYIYTTKDKQMFIASAGSGLLKMVKFDGAQSQFIVYSKAEGCVSDIILNIQEDERGKLWMSSAHGISSFNIADSQFNLYDSSNGLESEDFSEASVLKLKDNRIAMGSNAGLYIFDPSKIRKNNFIPPLVFTGFQISNQNAEIGAENSPLTKSIDYIDTLILQHNQSVFTISFAAMDMENTRNIEYAYRLKGFNDNWTILREIPKVTYTNLPKGDYVFEVKSTNSDGVWVENTRRINIEVKPAFWQSTIAYAIYAMIFIGLLLIFFYIQYVFFKLRNKVDIEHKVSNLKLRFFTDISHELRTPLTLIASPVEYLIKNEDMSDSAKAQMIVVQRNVDRMLRLVNQILDFRKIQNAKMKLKIEKIAIGEFVSQVGENFMRIAVEKEIKYTYNDKSNGISIWADKDKLEKIIFNLLSNAFKFTPAGKIIEVEVISSDESVTIRIQDEGVGMSKDKLSRLFERFESSVNYEGFQPGTGIGLSLTKELVDMHHATILADSQGGKGTWFAVSFRLGNKHYKDDVDYIVEDDDIPELEEDTQVTPPNAETPEGINDKQSILIVEDNKDLREFLTTVLEKEYRVIQACNGVEGLHHAYDNLPDIIISDVMMPEMDGIKLTHHLKDDVRTSHTPVILLTAKTAMEDRLEALSAGADDYITKPFSAEYLEARIKNLLGQRQKLQEMLISKLAHTGPESGKIEVAPSVPNVVSQDDIFIQNLINSLEENMENSELTVDDLVSFAGLSRSVFFKKLKSLTGLAPIEFIREMRIKRAAQLLETQQYNVSQVAYMVGMNDPRYFSRCFKQKYEMTPTEYKEKHAPKVQSV